MWVNIKAAGYGSSVKITHAGTRKKEGKSFDFFSDLFQRQFMTPSDVYTKEGGGASVETAWNLLWRQFQHFLFSKDSKKGKRPIKM